MAMPERELDQAKRHPDVVKNIIKKDGRKDAIPYSPSNPPPATEGGRIWYATCSTASGTGAKTATTSTGDFVLAIGSMVRVKFTTSNTAANPTISIDGSTAKTIQPKSGTSGMANLIAAGEVVDLVYDGSNFVMTKGSAATTSFYGFTKLNSSTSSTSTTEAATPSAVKDVADAKVNKAGDTMSGGLKIEKSGYSYCNVKSNDSQCALDMASAGGGAHGLFSSGYYDGSYHAGSKWLIYRDTSGGVIVNGHSTDDFNLGLKTSIPSGADLDTYKTVGTYSVSSSSVAASLLHCPTAIAFSMRVEYTLSSTYIKQTVEDYKGENTWARWFNSTWSAWVKTSAPLPLSISDVGCVTEVVTMSQLSLPASGTAHGTKDVSKTGYTPVGIVGITGSNTTGCNIMEFYLSGTTAHIWVNNNTATAKTPTYKPTILYFKS